MTSATLYREGPDLDALLAELDAEHPGAVRVVDIVHARDGGVLGFFARPVVGVHYELDGTAAQRPVIETRPEPVAEQPQDALAELIRAAEAGDAQRPVPGAVPSRHTPPDEPALEGPNAEFAQLLLQMAREKSAARDSVAEFAPRDSVVPVRPPVTPALPMPSTPPMHSTAPVAPPPAAVPTSPAARQITDLGLRRALTEIGVPIARIPADAAHKYAAVETLVARLPEAPALPAQAGVLIAVAGPAHELAAATETVRTRLHLAAGDVWSADTVTDPWQASIAAAAHRLTAERPAVVAVPTDRHESGWAREVLIALRPDAFWLHVDATRKPSDTRAITAGLPAPDALIVTGAHRTASPASVWELDVPVAALDGAAPTPSAWAVLLLERLAALEA